MGRALLYVVTGLCMRNQTVSCVAAGMETARVARWAARRRLRAARVSAHKANLVPSVQGRLARVRPLGAPASCFTKPGTMEQYEAFADLLRVTIAGSVCSWRRTSGYWARCSGSGVCRLRAQTKHSYGTTDTMVTSQDAAEHEN